MVQTQSTRSIKPMYNLFCSCAPSTLFLFPTEENAICLNYQTLGQSSRRSDGQARKACPFQFALFQEREKKRFEKETEEKIDF